MNPYESPASVPEKLSFELPWQKLLLLGFGLLFGVFLILPAVQPARQSGSYAEYLVEEKEVASDREPMEVSVNP
jgi:hypothetical protein